MKSSWVMPFLRSRYLLAVMAGFTLAAAFPNIGVAGLAWVAPALILWAALGTRGAETFRIGYVAGLTHYLTALYWLLLIPYRWHGVPLAPAAGWLALSAFLALFPAAWVWMVAPHSPGGQPSQTPRSPGQAPTQALIPGDQPSWKAAEQMRDVLGNCWARRTLWALGGAAIWVALEMVLARIMGGFPWDLLGVSQYRLTPLIQIASLTGVYGVSFLIIWFSLSLVSAALLVFRRPTTRAVWAGEIFLPALAVALAFNLGFRALQPSAPAPRTLRVTLVQPSIPQTLIWDTSRDAERFKELVELSDQALSNRTDLLIWPEAAVPKLFRYDEETFTTLTSLARRHQVWLIIGSDDFERRARAAAPDEGDYYNSSFLISPEGKLRDGYRKRSLVIFGEYLPLSRWLPFLKWFTPIQGGFTPGQGPGRFELTSLETEVCVLICFEDIFPHLARADRSPRTDLLVNLTNDGWFGEGAAQWQHGATALFRAVENRLPLLRCTNTGLTCWIDEHGRLREIFRDRRGTIYGAGFLTADIPLPAPGTIHTGTFYSRRGDWFGWTCVMIAVLLFGARLSPAAARRRAA